MNDELNNYTRLQKRVYAYVRQNGLDGKPYLSFRNIANKYGITLDLVEMLCEDSNYRLMPHANRTKIKGDTTVEWIGE